ncbi:hypothetical protein D3C84_494510 [compost metagenome]
MQVAQGIGVPGAVGALIESHGPATHPLGGLADPFCSLTNVHLGNAGEFRDLVRWIILEKLGHGLPAFGERGDEVRVGVAVFYQQVQQAIEQCQIGTWFDLQKQAGLVRRGATARIDHDQLRPGLDPIHHAQEQNRMTVGHIGADDEEQVRVIEVLIGTRRAIGTE